jgi:D-beta-D-heptose 7-phosphate kinase/D-beta-D-heptose 1-phosphate adenosyltransferase
MKRVLVIGDVMLDKYIETNPVRISDEAPVLIVKETDVSYVLGGAGNTAANLKAMGFDVVLQGVVGIDENGNIVKDILRNKGIIDALVISTTSIRTTVKKRILCKGRQVIRVDSEGISSPVNPLLDEKVDIVVVSDYAKGVIGADTIRLLKENYDVAVIVNGKPQNIRYYNSADTVVLNKREADEALVVLGVKEYNDIAGALDILYLVVTKGDKGIEAYNKDGLAYSVEADNVDVKDITGAGDTVTAALALEISLSGEMDKAIKVANLAGGIKVTKDKTSEVSVEELTANPESVGILSTEQIVSNLESDRLDG